MDIISKEGGCWPTRRQQLFMQAALLQGPRGIDAWRRWQVGADIDRLDPGCQRLLPQLYHTLRCQGENEAVVERFKGLYRRTWYQNQLLFHATANLLRTFHQAGIKTLVLKGAALAVGYYKDSGLRPMDDVDILVPLAQARAAVDLLVTEGWKPDEAGPGRHAWGFKNMAGWQIDLHWHVLQDCCWAGADDAFWAGAVPVKLQDVLTLALNAADQLLHVCVHGLRWNRVPALRWIADAQTIVQVAGSAMDWDRLIAQAEERRLILPMRNALRYLHSTLDTPAPGWVLSALNKAPVSLPEQIIYDARIHRKISPAARLQLWVEYLNPESGPVAKKLLDVVSYFRRRWTATSTALTIGSAF